MNEALERFGVPDVLHDNGIWLPHNHRLAMFGKRQSIPRVVSTRGMLEPWAVAHKSVKKRIAWWLYQRQDLERAACLHTTADKEADNLRRLNLGVPLYVIPNGVDAPIAEPRRDDPCTGGAGACNGKVALFLGRIYPVKGLPMLVEAWARVRPAGWRLHIAGPDEAGHQAEVAKAVATAGLSDVVFFRGAQEGDAKEAELLSADLFILPTHSESFGMAIAEALAHGLPVLTTTAAPWPMLSQRGCGWSVAPTTGGIAEGLRQATSLDSATLRAMGRRGREFVAAEFAWKRIAGQYLDMYEAARGA